MPRHEKPWARNDMGITAASSCCSGGRRASRCTRHTLHIRQSLTTRATDCRPNAVLASIGKFPRANGRAAVPGAPELDRGTHFKEYIFMNTAMKEIILAFAVCHRNRQTDEVIALAERMLYLDALRHRSALINGEPVTAWTTPVGNQFADDIFPMVDDRSAHIAELFLEGNLALVVRRHQPEPVLSWVSVTDLHAPAHASAH